MARSGIPIVVAALLMMLSAGCTPGAIGGASSQSNRRTAASAHPTPTSISPTPVTPNGLLTGAGVNDSTITLGLLVDRDADRGLAVGVALWQRAVNTSGGVCGRTVTISANRAGESSVAGYRRIAGSSLGLITAPGQSEAAALDAMVEADQIPAVTLGGSSATLTRTGPVVIGATEDIKAINALAYLRGSGKLPPGGTLGTLTDSSAEAVNALAGARWWAAHNAVTVVSRSPGDPDVADGWAGASAVLVLADAAKVRQTLNSTPSDVPVITDLDGYQPAQTPDPAGRLLVTMAAPAYGSDNPGAAAVAKNFVSAGGTNPGPNMLSGFGVAAAWGRLLTQACRDRALTHTGVRAAMTSVGPASVDSLFGPSDPGLVVGSQLPATRVSSVATADPAAPAGVRPLIWLQAAPGIGDYVPQR